MPGIVCAIRGGPASQPTIEKSIELALETNLPIHFLYVINLDFLSFTSSSRVHTITKELQHMGDFILLTAQSKAQAQGVTAQGVVRQGTVVDEIVELCREIQANYAVLGIPQGKGDQEEDVFTRARLELFGHRLKTESGAKVVLAERGAA
jgi:nucleotide-binding universal stress UspA family protein